MPVPLHRRASKRMPSTFAFQWRDHALRLVHTPDVVNVGWSHLELAVVDPPGAPLPLGLGAVYVLEIDEEAIIAAGGPVALIRPRLDAAAASAAYANALFRWRQGNLL